MKVDAKTALRGLLESGYTNSKTINYIKRLIRSINNGQLINPDQVTELIEILNEVDQEHQKGLSLPIGHHLMVAKWLNECKI